MIIQDDYMNNSIFVEGLKGGGLEDQVDSGPLKSRLKAQVLTLDKYFRLSAASQKHHDILISIIFYNIQEHFDVLDEHMLPRGGNKDSFPLTGEVLLSRGPMSRG